MTRKRSQVQVLYGPPVQTWEKPYICWCSIDHGVSPSVRRRPLIVHRFASMTEAVIRVQNLVDRITSSG